MINGKAELAAGRAEEQLSLGDDSPTGEPAVLLNQHYMLKEKPKVISG